MARTVSATSLGLAWLLGSHHCLADKPADLVEELPGFEHLTWNFKVYSGFLDVPGPINGYDALKIHYQFHTSQGDPAKDPVAVWHQGGPGGSSILVGLYGEMGAFTIGEKGNYLNPYAWNKVANMLYLESPAGSGGMDGFSECLKEGKPVPCAWDDKTQGEAYSHTLMAFFEAFPEFAKNPLFLTGESYFGQYGPNIAHFILNNEPFASKLNLKGLALGNACWGGNSTCVACNGPSEDKIDVDFFYKKAFFSPKLYNAIQKECKFPTEVISCEGDEPVGRAVLSEACVALLDKMFDEVGPHNIYDVYDNCESTDTFLRKVGKSRSWLAQKLRGGLADPSKTRLSMANLSGGYDWDCPGDAGAWITTPEVKKALHLDTAVPGASTFHYTLSGPASITLYPELVKKVHILIYNGDADACVPYNGNEEWIDMLESQGVLQEASPWKPWFKDGASKIGPPAGYITEYDVPGSDFRFTFATVRLAGHMVPQFQPEAGLRMLGNFLADRTSPSGAQDLEELVV